MACWTCSSLAELKRPEPALKLFVRFVLAKAAVGYGLDLLMTVFSICQGIISTIIEQSGIAGSDQAVLPQEIIDAINEVDFLNSIPLWIVTLIGCLMIIILTFVMILTVYSRIFKIYILSLIHI